MTDRTSAMKNLHTRLHDSIEGYKAAMERTDSPYLKEVMSDMVTRRTSAMQELHTYMTAQGIEASHDTSTLADVHRSFLKLKDSVTGAGDEAVLNEIVRGEETLLDAYDKAIGETGASDPEFRFLVDQREQLKIKVDEFRARARAA